MITPRQQAKLNHTFARVKGETIGVLERLEEVLKETLKILRTGDVQMPEDLHIRMRLINSMMYKVLAEQQLVRGVRVACKVMEAKL